MIHGGLMEDLGASMASMVEGWSKEGRRMVEGRSKDGRRMIEGWSKDGRRIWRGCIWSSYVPRMAYLVLRWPSQSQDGLVSPRMAQLVPGWPSQSQDGLVMADLLEKFTFFDDFSIRALKLAANQEKQVFYVFCIFTPLSAFQAFRCIANDRA